MGNPSSGSARKRGPCTHKFGSRDSGLQDAVDAGCMEGQVRRIGLSRVLILVLKLEEKGVSADWFPGYKQLIDKGGSEDLEC